MSTFWLNSEGNLVLLRSLASTPVAMVGSRLLVVLCRPTQNVLLEEIGTEGRDCCDVAG